MLNRKFILAVLGAPLAFILAACSSKVAANSNGYDATLMQSDPGAAIAKMAAVTAVGFQVVKTDAAARSLVVRDGVSGELSVMKFDPAGKQMVFDKDAPTPASIAPEGAPAWMPLYPNTAPERTGNVGAETTYIFHSKDSPTKVIEFYSSALKAAGLTIDQISTDTKDGGFITASGAGKTRTVTINVSTTNPITDASIIIADKK